MDTGIDILKTGLTIQTKAKPPCHEESLLLSGSDESPKCSLSISPDHLWLQRLTSSTVL